MALRLESAASRIGRSNVARPRLGVTYRALQHPAGGFRGSALNVRKGGLEYQNLKVLKWRGGVGIIRCSGAAKPAALSSVPKTLSDHILDRVSCFLITQGKRLMPKSFSAEDPLHWLPPKLHEQLHKSEAVATTLVREGLVFGTLGLMYCQVDAFCHGLYKIASSTRRAELLEEDRGGYEESVFHTAADPLRGLITVWAFTRVLRHLAFSAQLQHYIAASTFFKARALGVVTCVTWFIFRCKQHWIDNYISQHKIDTPRILAFDRLVSLLLYFLAVTCFADILDFPLRSLLAFGGISGIAVGLAAKEVVSNFFGGLVIFLTRPFVIGERIKAGAISGLVTDIGYMQTKVLGFDGTPLLVPNQAFTNQVITNFSRANTKQMEASFYLNNQDVLLVNKISENVVEYLKTVRQVDKIRSTPQCYLNTMGYGGPEMVVLCTINLGGGSFFSIRQEIMVQVAKIIDDVLGEESPYFRSSVSNLLGELRMHLLYAGQGAPPGK